MVYSQILNNGHNQPDYNVNVSVANKTDGTPYYTITSFRMRDGLYYVTDIHHYVNGLDLSILKRDRWGVAVIDWFKENTDIKQ